MSQPPALVNTVAIRGSIRRIFTGLWPEILAELFQNSYRAHAKTVHITTTATGFVYVDNGDGLSTETVHGGYPEGIFQLLTMGETGFDPDVIRNQNPMGLGIHALLANDAVARVAFSSGTVGISIDTERWWSAKDQDYYNNWDHLLFRPATSVNGLRIEVEMRDCALLAPPPNNYGTEARSVLELAAIAMATGYNNEMIIRFNDQWVSTKPTGDDCISRLLGTTSYLGCELIIGFGSQRGYNAYSLVNWYGQLVQVASRDLVRFQLMVRAGQPVTPMAPTRKGLIVDAKLDALHRFVEDYVFAELMAERVPKDVLTAAVTYAFERDKVRALRLPYFLATELSKHDDRYGQGELLRRPIDTKAEVFEYRAPPQLITAVRVHAEPAIDASDDDTLADEIVNEYGLGTLLNSVPMPVYMVKHCDAAQLSTPVLVWRPGPLIEEAGEHVFYESGHWAFSDGPGDNEGEVAWLRAIDTWQPVDELVVFFDDNNSYDATVIKFAVGLPEGSSPDEFYRGSLDVSVFAACDYENDEGNTDDYNESVDAILRERAGGAVSHVAYIELERSVDEALRTRNVRAKVISITKTYAGLTVVAQVGDDLNTYMLPMM